MDFTWKIIHIWEEEKIGDKELPKIMFVVEELDSQYPSSISIDLLWDKTQMLSSYNVWDTVTASLNFRAREYKWRYFNGITARKITWWDASWAWVSTTTPDEDDDLPF